MEMDQECRCSIEDIFEKSFSSRCSAEKEDIIKGGKPTPKLNLITPAKSFVRHFRPEYYTNTPWLSGCAKYQKFYCWPCILFSKEMDTWNKNGFNDLSNFSNARRRHENSKFHIDAFVKLKQLENQHKIENNLNHPCRISLEDYNKTVAANRYIVSKLTDVICFLPEHELAFKGHVESSTSSNRGNYIELLHLLSTSDTLLKFHLEKSTIFSGCTKRIQNDLIDSIGNVLLEEIRREINAAQFVSVIVGGSTDISHRGQMSTVLRYVNEAGDVEERFVGFENVSPKKDLNSLVEHMTKYLDQYDCNSKKLVAQTYDNAAITTGQHNGVHAKIKKAFKHAIFVHCYAHRLNLVFSQSLNFIKECRIFFQTITGFSSFFSKSTNRSYALDEAIKKRLPSAAPTKWNDSSVIINYIIEYKEELKELFFNMTDCPIQWDAETAIAAKGLYQYLTDFDFVFLLELFSKIFAQSDILFDILQKDTFDVGYCIIKITEFIIFLQNTRNNFDSIWYAVENEENIFEIHPTKRLRVDNIESSQQSYKRLFFEVIDTLVHSCNDRFSNMKSLKFLSLLNVSKFKEYGKQFPETCFSNLNKSYGDVLDMPKLRSELIYLYANFSDTSLTYIKDTMIKDDLHVDVLKELYAFITLVYTIPASAASVESECTFSTMQRIHAFARNAQHDEIMSSLALISIEKQLLCKLKDSITVEFHERVIDDFAEKNSSIDLIYKK